MVSMVAMLLLCYSLSAQDAFYVSAGATAVRKTIIPQGDIGVKLNLNVIAFNLQTYEQSPKTFCLPGGRSFTRHYERKWVTGVKYGRLIPIGKSFALLPNATGGIYFDEDPRFVWTGGLSLQLRLAKNLHLQSITQFPLVQNTGGHYHYAGVQNGLMLNVLLFQ